MATHPFVLLENFQWLIDRLDGFEDPQFTYNSVGLPNIKGGKRRVYRKNNHFPSHYTVTKVGKVTVKFNTTPVVCDKYKVYHDKFSDKNLKERYPVPGASANPTNPKAVEEPAGPQSADTAGHTVLITSKDSFDDQTAPRYWVSCSCMDFDTTFLQKLIDYGYTTNFGGIPPSNGIKKLDPTICKHIYAVIVDNYQSVLAAEGGVAVQAANIMPWTTPVVSAPQPLPAPTTIVPNTPAKKEDYEKLIIASLRRLSNQSSDSISAYKCPSDSAKHYRKYKFMVKWYPKGWAIVFTNPEMNPEQNPEYKELVPIYTRTSNGMRVSGHSPLKVYSYFTKDELKNLIKNNSKEIQPNQIARLKSILGIKTNTPDSSWLTENLEFIVSVKNTVLEFL